VTNVSAPTTSRPQALTRIQKSRRLTSGRRGVFSSTITEAEHQACHIIRTTDAHTAVASVPDAASTIVMGSGYRASVEKLVRS